MRIDFLKSPEKNYIKYKKCLAQLYKIGRIEKIEESGYTHK